MTLNVSDGIVRQIVNEVVKALRGELGLSENQCYPTIAPAYVAGMPRQVVQVAVGEVTPDEAPFGAQPGGAMLRRLMLELTLWYTLDMDAPNRSDQVLIRASEGVLDYMESIRNIFRLTVLDGIIYAPMRYEGETATVWFDDQGHIARRSIRFSAPFGESLPDIVSYPSSSSSST